MTPFGHHRLKGLQHGELERGGSQEDVQLT